MSPQKPGQRPDCGPASIQMDRVRSAIIVFAVMVFWTVTLSGAALAFPCSPPKSAAKVSLHLEPGQPQYVYDLDTAGIRNVVSDIRGYVAGPWHLPLGLTMTELGVRFETRFFVHKPQGGGYCVALAEAEVTVGFSALRVYISSNYAEGSCEFDAIMAHEQEHVQANREVIEDYKARFRALLRLMRRGKKVIFVHRKTATRSAYILHLRHQFEPLVAEMKAALARRNSGIDTKENYQRVLAQCDNWFEGDLAASGPKTDSRPTGIDDPVEANRAALSPSFKIIHAPSANPE